MSSLIPRDNDPVLEELGIANPLADRMEFFSGLWRRGMLSYKLLRDPRVELMHKIIPLAALFYVLSPLDFMPAFLAGPIGLVDDFVLLYAALDWFMRLVPYHLLTEHAAELGYLPPPIE